MGTKIVTAFFFSITGKYHKKMIILSSSGGIFIIAKFTAYFVYKVRKVLRNSESEGEAKHSKTLGLLSKSEFENRKT